MSTLKIIPLEERIVLDAAAVVIYVDGSATGSNDGSSWTNAYTDLQSALSAASATAGAEQIWIADGIYTPSQVYSPNGVLGGAYGISDTSLVTFNLPDNVSLYGGFAGNESSILERNPSLNLTILSGEIGDPLLKSDNAWHVVTAGNDIARTGVSANIDGLIIQDGYADGPHLGTVNNFTYNHKSGGGLSVRFGSEININDVTFRDNFAGLQVAPINVVNGSGGGILVSDLGTHVSVFSSNFYNNSTATTNESMGGAISLIANGTLEVYNSEFKDNLAGRWGGAIGAFNTTNDASLIIENSTFINNRVENSTTFQSLFGGAIFVIDTDGRISDSVFQDNSVDSLTRTRGGGGAIFLDEVGSPTYTMQFLIEDSVFQRNEAIVGGALQTFSNLIRPDSLITITNTVFDSNKAVIGGAILVTMPTDIVDSTFKDNVASSSGGAIGTFYLSQALGAPLPSYTTNILDSNFTDNLALGQTSELNRASNWTSRIFNLNFNDSLQGGGAITSLGGANINIHHSTFKDNHAVGDGGAILNGAAIVKVASSGVYRSLNHILTISDSVMMDNVASGNGGAVASYKNPLSVSLGHTNTVSLTVVDSEFKKNDAENGGALYVKTSIGTILDNTFWKNNDANSLGDKIYIENSIVNGIASVNAATLLQNLINNNNFKNLVNDDLYII